MQNKRKKAMILCGNIETFIPVVEELEKNHLLTPVFWSARKQNKEKIKAAFSSIVFYDSLCDGVYANVSNTLNISLDYSCITSDLIDRFAIHERVFMEMLYTRSDSGGGFNHYEAQKIYHEHLAQAFVLLKYFETDVLIMETAPHLMWDYMLYAVALHLKLNIVILSDTPIPNRMVVYRDLNGRNVSEGNPTKQELNIDLPDDITRYIASLRSDFLSGTTYMLKALMPNNDKKLHWSIDNISRRLDASRKKIKKSLWVERKNKILDRENDISDKHYLKQSNVSWKDSFSMAGDFHSQRLKDLDRRIALLNRYKELSVEADLEKDYIYFPLHLQPENTTVPMAGLFSNQYLALTLLRQAIPSHWKIYVKEAPYQFEWHRGNFARHPRYYDEILELENIDLIKMETDPFQLIDHAKCIFSITGSTGWEASVRGKVVLVAGSSVWYMGAPGCYQVKSMDDIRNVISYMDNKRSVLNDSDITSFLTVFLNRSYNCVVNASHIETLVKDKEKNIENIIQAITDNIE